MLVDSHCHLDFLETAAERVEVIARARRAGVGAMVTIGTKITEFPAVLAIAESEPDIWCSVGIHPHEAAAEPETAAETLARLSDHPKVVGIGETGLDFYYEHSPRVRQAEVFRAHCQAARATGLPLIVHTRDADGETAQILSEECARGPLTGVIHCFSSGVQLADKAISLGFYISLSGIVTFKNAEALRDIVRGLPKECILVETDAPYLAPVPLRGKRNEPAFIVHTAAQVARIRGWTNEELAEITTANFYRLFSKAKPPAATS